MSTMNDKKLTHVDSDGHAVMVDVSDRAITIRQATAHGTVHFSPEVTQLLHNKIFQRVTFSPLRELLEI